MRFQFKRNDKIGFIFFIAFVLSTSLIYQFEERFDQERWQTQPGMRYKMADDIIEKQLLIGKTKREVIDMLGASYATTSLGKDVLVYRLGRPPSFSESKSEQLLVVFEDQKAIKVSRIQEQ